MALKDKVVANYNCQIKLGFIYIYIHVYESVYALVVDGLWCCDVTEGSRIAGKDLRFKLMRQREPLQFRDTFEDHRRNTEKLSKHIQPPQNHYKHMSEAGPNRINNLNKITSNGVTEVFQIYSLQTIDGSRGFPEMSKIIPTSLPRNDLFSSNGIFNLSRESGPMPGRGKAIVSMPITHAAPMSSIMQRKPRDVCFLASDSFVFFLNTVNLFCQPTFYLVNIALTLCYLHLYTSTGYMYMSNMRMLTG